MCNNILRCALDFVRIYNFLSAKILCSTSFSAVTTTVMAVSLANTSSSTACCGISSVGALRSSFFAVGSAYETKSVIARYLVIETKELHSYDI